MELNQSILCPHRFSKGRIRKASRTADGIELKLSSCVEGDVEEIKGAMLLMLLQLLVLYKLQYEPHRVLQTKAPSITCHRRLQTFWP